MSRRRDNEGPAIRPSGTGGGWHQFLTLAGLAVAVVFSIVNWNETRKLQQAFDQRFGSFDTKLSQLGTKVDQAARQAAPQPRGPDPNKVYAVKTDTAPAEGPKSAPVVIAEFSDFQ
jgi:protein-disulfide isomerase